MHYDQKKLMEMPEDEELQYWKKYQETRDETIREMFIVKYSLLVKYVAGKIAMGMPKKIEFDDLVGYGTFGLLDAVDRYNPDMNTKFKTYAMTRIRGSIFDELRSDDWVPRTVRQKIKELEKVTSELEEKLDRLPTDEEIAHTMNISVKELQKLYLSLGTTTVLSFNDPVYAGKSDNKEKMVLENVVEGSENLTPNHILENKELKNMVAKEIYDLPEKERMVLILYYYEDLTLKEIGKVLDVTESRVSQLHTKAIFKLRHRIRKVKKNIEQGTG